MKSVMYYYIYNGYIAIGYIEGASMSKNNSLDSEQLTDSMYYILLALVKKRHGYAIMKFIEDVTHHEVTMGPGTLYTLLKKLCKANWIEPIVGDERTKEYKITAQGYSILTQEYQRRCQMVQIGKQILTEDGYEE